MEVIDIRDLFSESAKKRRTEKAIGNSSTPLELLGYHLQRLQQVKQWHVTKLESMNSEDPAYDRLGVNLIRVSAQISVLLVVANDMVELINQSKE